MVIFMKENGIKANQMDLENLFGLVVKFIKECVPMESKMEKERYIIKNMIFGQKEYGKMVEELKKKMINKTSLLILL